MSKSKVTVTLSVPDKEVSFSCWQGDRISVSYRGETVDVYLSGTRVLTIRVEAGNEQHS